MGQAGFTLVELTVSLVVMSMMIVALFGLFISLVRSTVIAKRRAVASSLATNQMEYLKSLPYDSLAVVGGSIIAPNLLPNTKIQTINGVKYTVKTSISYADDSYDGCGPYPNIATKEKYCRNYPPPTGSPATDGNPGDYKTVNVTVKDSSDMQLAVVDTQISARVSETASNTGALFVTVTDPSGTPISEAQVTLVNATTTPAVNVADTTDSNGVSIFYGMPPDTVADYTITATKTGYSSLSTIAASGSLQPTYPKQAILAQQASYLTMPLAKMTTKSLIIEATDTSGAPLAGIKVYVKGGYKKYTVTSDTSYYYDNFTPIDVRPTSGADGVATVDSLVPINRYVFCGDLGETNCRLGATTYYLAAAVPYSGTNPLNPINIPEELASPNTGYDHGGQNYVQKVRLLFTPSASFPRVFSVTPSSISASSGSISTTSVTVNGKNLSSAAVNLRQSGTDYTGSSCTGSDTQRTCEFNLTGISFGASLQIIVTNAAGTLELPTTPLGGIDVAS